MIKKQTNKKQIAVRQTKGRISVDAELLADLRTLISQARTRVAQQVNSELAMLNWHIGNRIRKEILHNERADYGEAIVESLAKQLTMEYGQGYTRFALFRMVKFSELFPDWKIVATLSQQLCPFGSF